MWIVLIHVYSMKVARCCWKTIDISSSSKDIILLKRIIIPTSTSIRTLTIDCLLQFLISNVNLLVLSTTHWMILRFINHTYIFWISISSTSPSCGVTLCTAYTLSTFLTIAIWLSHLSPYWLVLREIIWNWACCSYEFVQ